MRINAIPGFLGLPSDWDFLDDLPLNKIDLTDYDWNSLTAWAKDFNQKNSLKNNFLMGYSLGGRLALHALLDQPDQWQGAIIISSHYGLAYQKLRQQRLMQDEHWAQRFEKDVWLCLMNDWNQQEIFKQDPVIERIENDYQRSDLIQQLKKGSLGHQKNLKKSIEQLNKPILWITGELDQRYHELAAQLVFFHPLSKWKVIPEGGHRLLWSQPDKIKKEIESFIKNVNSYSFL